MKAVLISIKPKWVELILKGKKTVEVRKTVPKLKTPFKVYIYCTQAQLQMIEVIHKGDDVYGVPFEDEKPLFVKGFKSGAEAVFACGRSGKVVAEFTCDRINEYDFFIGHGTCGYVDGYESHCLTEEELCEYGNGKNLYGWHICELKVYDKPKELTEFKGVCRQPNDVQCENCPYCDWNGGKDFCKDKRRIITRPPQSYCYVEELGE